MLGSPIELHASMDACVLQGGKELYTTRIVLSRPAKYECSLSEPSIVIWPSVCTCTMWSPHSIASVFRHFGKPLGEPYFATSARIVFFAIPIPLIFARFLLGYWLSWCPHVLVVIYCARFNIPLFCSLFCSKNNSDKWSKIQACDWQWIIW